MLTPSSSLVPFNGWMIFSWTRFFIGILLNPQRSKDGGDELLNMERGQKRGGRESEETKDRWLTLKEVKNEENSLMFHIGFDLENIAQFCSLFKISLHLCVRECVCSVLCSAVRSGFLCVAMGWLLIVHFFFRYFSQIVTCHLHKCVTRSSSLSICEEKLSTH